MAFPLKPPADWFDTPEPDGPQPLTIDSEGRVTGHLALWSQCHTSFGECLSPPRSQDGYASFHVGALETADGSEVPVGKLVYATKHAPLESPVTAAARHYDDTGHTGAFVRARDGAHGIWLAGALRSDISAQDLRDLKVNPPSGDWRRVKNNLELIAALAVAVPGYPVPRTHAALAASADEAEVDALIIDGYYEPEALVASAEPRSKQYLRQRSQIDNSLTAAVLSTKRRNSMPRSAFAVPEERAYPIHDESHARAALSRSSGKPEEARVRRAVCRRYPNMGECAT